MPNIEEEGGFLGQAQWQHKRLALSEPLTAPSGTEDVEELYDTAWRIQYRLKRVGPQAQNIHSSKHALHLDTGEAQRVSEVLRGRLLRNEPQSLANLNQESFGQDDFLETSQERLKLLLSDEIDLLKFSQDRLKALLLASHRQPAPTTRLRIFGQDNDTFLLPEPAMKDLGTPSTATMYTPTLPELVVVEGLTIVALSLKRGFLPFNYIL